MCLKSASLLREGGGTTETGGKANYIMVTKFVGEVNDKTLKNDGR